MEPSAAGSRQELGHTNRERQQRLHTLCIVPSCHTSPHEHAFCRSCQTDATAGSDAKESSSSSTTQVWKAEEGDLNSPKLQSQRASLPQLQKDPLQLQLDMDTLVIEVSADAPLLEVQGQGKGGEGKGHQLVLAGWLAGISSVARSPRGGPLKLVPALFKSTSHMHA